MQRGCVLALTGKASDAVQTITSGIAAMRSTGTTMWMPVWLSYLARAQAELGQFDVAGRCIGEAMTAVETAKERWYEAEVSRIAGEIALLSPEPDVAKAETYFDRALAVAQKQQAKSWELRAATSMARLWRDLGRRPAGPQASRSDPWLVRPRPRHARLEAGQEIGRRTQRNKGAPISQGNPRGLPVGARRGPVPCLEGTRQTEKCEAGAMDPSAFSKSAATATAPERARRACRRTPRLLRRANSQPIQLISWRVRSPSSPRTISPTTKRDPLRGLTLPPNFESHQSISHSSGGSLAMERSVRCPSAISTFNASSPHSWPSLTERPSFSEARACKAVSQEDGKAVVALYCIEYRKTDIGPYNEVGLTVLALGARRSESRQTTWSIFLSRPRLRTARAARFGATTSLSPPSMSKATARSSRPSCAIRRTN